MDCTFSSCELLARVYKKIMSIKHASQAYDRVFVVDYENQAYLPVYKVRYERQAIINEGLLYFVECES